MGIMNEIKGGADLTHPKATSGWIIGATMAAVILMVVIGIAGYLYRNVKKIVPSTSGSVKTATDGLSGIFGDGT